MSRSVFACLGAGLAAFMSLVCPASAASFKILYTFQQQADGGFPFASLIPGPNGSFFGASDGAGPTAGFGTIFQIFPPASGSTKWTLTTLYTFTGGSDGAFPNGLVRAASGALYGVAGDGGTTNALCGTGPGYGCGTVFELTPPPTGQNSWSFKVIHSFSGPDGAFPISPPAIGADGGLYGVANNGGKCSGDSQGCGVVYRLTPPAGTAATWEFKLLAVLGGGPEGEIPRGPPLLDKNGVIYGETAFGGIVNTPACKTQSGCGTIFSLTPPTSGKTLWTLSTLYQFTGTIGSNARGGLTIDAKGNLFGTAHNGGRLLACPATYLNSGCGTVFQISPPAAGATKWTGQLLYAFTDGPDGSRPWDAPLLVNGTLYLTSSGDEVKTDGSIIRLEPPASGGTVWKETTLYTFLGQADSDDPTAALVLRDGTFYGVAEGDGQGPAPAGTVFSLTP